MEVHKHPHHVTHPKKWFEYLLEFLMIFLAVSLGFVAENIHEHSLEVKATEGNLRTFQGELLHHKNVLKIYDSIYSAMLPNQDSMVKLFYEKRENENLANTGRFFINCKRLILLPIQTSAYDQLVNSGGLKNIRNQSLKDSMSNYAGEIRSIDRYNAFINSSITAMIPQLNSLEDFHDIYPGTGFPQLERYPVLTEKERRFIIAHYKFAYIQSLSNMTSLRKLKETNDRLLKMVEQHLD